MWQIGENARNQKKINRLPPVGHNICAQKVETRLRVLVQRFELGGRHWFMTVLFYSLIPYTLVRKGSSLSPLNGMLGG